MSMGLKTVFLPEIGLAPFQKIVFCVLIKHVSTGVKKSSHCFSLSLVSLKMYLWQSSSATTSIVVAMAASGAITLREGIPVIMGSNVGTSVTSTMVGIIAISTDNPAIYTNIYLFLITTQYLPISTNIYQCPGVPDDPAQPGGVQAGLLRRHHPRPVQLVHRHLQYLQYLHIISTISTHNICTLYLQYIQVHNPRPVAYRDRDWVLGEAYR